MERPPLTFARFLELPENRLALAAAQEAANRVYSRRVRPAANPLYLHGPPGSGKTHLVSALMGEVIRRGPEMVAASLHAEDLEGLGVSCEATRHQAKEAVQAARDADLLVVENVHKVTSRSVESFATLLDYLLARRVQVVVTALVGPGHLSLSSRLISRLAQGLVVALEPLQVASRRELLFDKAQRRQLALSRDIFDWLAGNFPGGGRQLEGALNLVEALARTSSRPLDVAAVAAHFRDRAETPRPTVEIIAAKVCRFYQVDSSQLRSLRRSRNVLMPRQVSMYLARKLTALSLQQIGAYFGGRDHSTVLHACRKVEQALDQDTALNGTVRQLQAELV